MLLSPADVMSQ